MDKKSPSAVEALIVAVPETAGSALYGMIDVLASTGQIWQQLVGRESSGHLIKPRIVSLSVAPFVCGHGIPIHPDVGLQSDPSAEIVILPE
ncbi:MAG: hypothetical protein PVF41_09505, partial [Methyloceanibacter sp.]